MYDIVIVGGGHAGAEAAASAARMGSKVLLITMNIKNLVQMSCNPAMGGISKGQIIREIDALGGLSGIITDKTMIQFKMLNKSKGPAMWSPRAQSDRINFSKEWRYTLESINNIDFFQDTVISLLIKKNRIIGVQTMLGLKVKCHSVILTTGTFLNGIIFIGKNKLKGGRIYEGYVTGLTEQLNELGFKSGRMKTGTSPRLDGRSLNYYKMKEQIGDKYPKKFSFLDTNFLVKQRSCYLTYTNDTVHEILRKGFDKSPIFNGTVNGVGPRYCPSIEDKIYRFPNKENHQIFVEPEGWTTNEVYVNGFSTSLPEEIQYSAIHKITGFENAKIINFGYAVEYDFFSPIQLKHTLETKIIDYLFFAGQINGTTGYEEAAAQGLIAGINSHLRIREKDPLVLKRSDAYIGVLIDDLVTKGTNEPYRMFTARAEYRTLLRQDNADERLTPIAYKIGLVGKERMNLLDNKLEKINNCISYFNTETIKPEMINNILKKKGNSMIYMPEKSIYLIYRPEINIQDILSIFKFKKYFIFNNFTKDELEEIFIQIKYRGYILKEKKEAKKLTKLENILIPQNFDYSRIINLSLEAREKLDKIRPTTIGQAYRISGISPTDITYILIHMKR
jgi:tRNA uridine 5-carboxymethylaminomethyl modification enzyme